MRRRLAILSLALAVAAPSARAQGRWKRIGETSKGNPIFVDQKSVKRHGGMVDATVRVAFTTPVATPKGPLSSSKAVATFDCATRKVAVKENTLFLDEKKGTVFEHTVNRIPGFGPAFEGSLPYVAMNYLCAAPK